MNDRERERVEKKYAYDKAWKKKNVERAIEHRDKYQRSEKGKLTRRNAKHRRRAIEKAGSCTTTQLNKLVASSMNEDGLFLCVYCNNYSTLYEVEHVLPLSRGGLHDIDNIAVACPPCNRRKGNKTVEEFNASTVDSTHDRTNPDDSL